MDFRFLTADQREALYNEVWSEPMTTCVFRSKKATTMKSFERAIKLKADLYWAYYGISCLYALQGKKKLALQFLEKAFQKGFRDIVHLEKDDDWKEFRDDSQFKELIRKSQDCR